MVKISSSGYPSLIKCSLFNFVGAKKNFVPAEQTHVSICSGNGSSRVKNQSGDN